MRPSYTRDTLLIIGNGFAIDYVKHASGMPNPSNPLNFPVMMPGKPNKLLSEIFTELWGAIEELRAKEPGMSDFQVAERLRCTTPHTQYPDAWVDQQLRLYLVHAYTHFSQLIDYAKLETWRWHSWLCMNKNRLHTMVSFNYDILLEKAIWKSVTIRCLIGQNLPHRINSEVKIFKPHGSINFEFVDGILSGGDLNMLYEKKTLFRMNEGLIRLLGSNELDRPRINADIVLPSEASSIRKLRHIAHGFRFLEQNRSCISRCIIVGLSYWECDRPEINEILGNLGRNTKITICNPCPPKDLEVFVRERFCQVEILTANLPV